MHILHFPFFFSTNNTGKDHEEWEGMISSFSKSEIISFLSMSECSFESLYGFYLIGLFIVMIIVWGSNFSVLI